MSSNTQTFDLHNPFMFSDGTHKSTYYVYDREGSIDYWRIRVVFTKPS